MHSSPYRALALPRRQLSCNEPSPCDAHLARPPERRRLQPALLRLAWAAVGSLATMMAGAVAFHAAMPRGGIELGAHPLRKSKVTEARQLAYRPHAPSMLAGAVHDGATLYDFAREAKREGLDLTLVDAWASPDARGRGDALEEVLGLSPRDRVLSVDGYSAAGDAWPILLSGDENRRHVIELQRDGRRVVISLRRGA